MSSSSSPIRDLLRRGDTDGYPTDYLIARIRARRAALVHDWRTPAAAGLAQGTSDERIWGALLAELAWLYAQMNPALRETFAPMFGLFELKTIVLCLRNASLRRTQEVERLLDRSLLSDGLREVLHRGDRRAAVGALAATMAGTRPAFGELEAVYEEEGLKGLENGLMRVYLEEISREPLDPDVRAFFVLFTDLRNVVLLYKHLRWNLAGECRVIAGGSLAPARLHEVLAHRDEDGFHALVRRATGLDAVPAAVDEGALETVLLRSVGRRLEATRREGGDVGVILSYIWRVYVQARNLALLHHGSGLDAATLGRELIL